MRRFFLIGSAWWILGRIEYLLPASIKTKPLRRGRRGIKFFLRRSRLAGEYSAAGLAADDVAEPGPGVALEFLELQLFDRREIGSAGGDLDARQQAAASDQGANSEVELACCELLDVSDAPIATKFCSAAKSRDAPMMDICRSGSSDRGAAR
jgi:hypothetical protein